MCVVKTKRWMKKTCAVIKIYEKVPRVVKVWNKIWERGREGGRGGEISGEERGGRESQVWVHILMHLYIIIMVQHYETFFIIPWHTCIRKHTPSEIDTHLGSVLRLRNIESGEWRDIAWAGNSNTNRGGVRSCFLFGYGDILPKENLFALMAINMYYYGVFLHRLV